MLQPHKKSKQAINRQKMTEVATKRSMKTISQISLDPKHEEKIIQLFAHLDGIQLVDHEVEKKKIYSDKMDLIESDNEETTLPKTVKPANSDDENDEDTSNTMTRKKYLKKLTRDDRFMRKKVMNNDILTAETLANNIRKNMVKVAKKEAKALLTPGKSLPQNSKEPVLPTPASSMTSLLAASGNVRFTVTMKSKGKNTDKLVVYPRETLLDDIINDMRKKFNVGKKFNALKIVGSTTVLNNFLFSMLNDEEKLELIEHKIEKQSTKVEPSVKTLPPVPPQITPSKLSAGKEEEISLEPLNLSDKPNETIETDGNNIENVKNPEEISPVTQEIDDTTPMNTFDSSNGTISIEEDKDIQQLDAFKSHANKNPIIDQQLLETYQQKQTLSSFQSIQKHRQTLPISASKEEILSAIERNRVILICGETGSGKTTQTPLFILEQMIATNQGSVCNIICTQPRRLAAVSVAERVSYECGEEKIGELVGYCVRLQAQMSAKTRLLFCTIGILLKKLHDNTFLSNISHIVLDEVHERGVEIDFLMTILKDKMNEFPHLKLILMSATIQEEVFRTYFNNCPTLYVSGRCFPVTTRYLHEIEERIHGRQLAKIPPNHKANPLNKPKEEIIAPPRLDSDLLVQLICHIIATSSNTKVVKPRFKDRGETILVFLSGINAIENINKLLRTKDIIRQNDSKIFILHSSLPPYEQKQIFKPSKFGQWKIILSTNIAETSITVDDVTHVIDSGFQKEKRYNPITGLSSLQEVFVSRANANQRKGRAGRVTTGECWRLYAQDYFDSKHVDDYPMPEIQRISLEEVILQILILQLGQPYDFLLKCIQPPSKSQTQAAMANLIEIKATIMEDTLKLTPLGFHLAKMPMDVHLGKMLLYASLLKCVEPALTIAAAMSGKSPFVSPIQSRGDARSKHLLFLHSEPSGMYTFSDHLAIVEAYNRWSHVQKTQGNSMAYKYARAHYLSHEILLDIKLLRDYFRDYLIRAGFESSYSHHKTTKEGEDSSGLTSLTIQLLRCTLCAGFYPHVIRGIKITTKETTMTKFIQLNQEIVALHPACLISSRMGDIFHEDFPDSFFVYNSKTVQNDRIQIFDVSYIPHIILLLFSGSQIMKSDSGKVNNRRCIPVKMNDTIEMLLMEIHLVCFRRLQNVIEELFLTKLQSTKKQQEINKLQTFLMEVLTLLIDENQSKDEEEDDEEDEDEEN